MQVRMSEEETKLVHELVQDALIDEARRSQGHEFEGGVVVTKMRDVMLEAVSSPLEGSSRKGEKFSTTLVSTRPKA